jgi:hypothetical protein
VVVRGAYTLLSCDEGMQYYAVLLEVDLQVTLVVFSMLLTLSPQVTYLFTVPTLTYLFALYTFMNLFTVHTFTYQLTATRVSRSGWR